MNPGRLNRFGGLLACVSLLYPATTFSDPLSPYVDDQDLLAEINISSSATRLEQDVLHTPAPVTVITRQMIQLSGITEVPHLLRLAPGFVSYDIDGSRTSVTSRGLTEKFPGELEIMIDGRSIYAPIFSAVEWSSIGITVDDIERIEVVRSSNAPTQGSNAFLGAINIITSEAASRTGTFLDLKTGNPDYRDAQLRHFGSSGGLAYKLNINYHSDDGFRGLATPIYPWESATDSHEAMSGGLGLVFTPSLQDSLNIDLGYSHSRQEYPDYYHIPVTSGFIDRDIDNNFQSIVWTREQQGDETLQIKLEHTGLKFVEGARSYGQLSTLLSQLGVPQAYLPILFDAQGIEDQMIARPDEIGRSEQFDLELQTTRHLPSGSRMVLGGGLSHHQLQGAILIADRDQASQWSGRLFGNHEWAPADQWLINSGAMLEHREHMGYLFSPRIAVNYLLDSHQVVRMSATRGKRSPSTLDFFQGHDFYSQEGVLLLRDIGSDKTHLRPARVDSFDIGYVGKFHDNRILLDIRAFYEKVQDYIGYREAGAAGILNAPVRYRSSNRVWHTRGSELQLRYTGEDGFLASLQYAYTSAHGDLLANSDSMTFERYSGYLPRHNLSLLAAQRFDSGFELSTMLIHQSATRWLTGNPVEDFSSLRLRLAKAWRLDSQKLDIALIYKSPLGEHATYYYFNHDEEQLLLSLEFAF